MTISIRLNLPLTEPKSFRWLLGITGVVIICLSSLLIFTRVDNLRTVIYDIVSPIQSILVAGMLFLTARITAAIKPDQAKSWRLWTFAFAFYALGDICWAFLELILKQAPFPSVADIFYFLCYVFLWLGLVRYPVDIFTKRERSLMWLDNLIVVLGASLTYWVLLINPMIRTSGEVDFFSVLLAVAYPILDMVLLWTLLIFFRNRLHQSTYVPLILMGFSLLSQIIADSLFAYQSVNASFIGNSSPQLVWNLGLIFLVFASISQVNSISADTDQSKITGWTKSFNSWPLYLPYLWLAVSYGILITYILTNRNSLLLYLIVGIIALLVILRQVLTLNENNRLFNKAGQELAEREQAQEALERVNLELDTRVQERTKKLSVANEELVQTNLKLAESLHEKDIMLKEIHHRVKNNLQIISSLLNLQIGKMTDTHTIQALRESQARVLSMALIHEKLYHSESLAKIDFGGYVKNLASDLFRSYQRGLGDIKLIVEIDEVDLDLDTSVSCGLILNELMTNALKYAFPDGNYGTIKVELLTNPGHILTLKVADDGIGLPANLDIFNTKSLGLQLVNSLVTQVEGKLEVESSTGTAFQVSFKY